VQDCPPHKDYVRIEFEGAHMITPLKDRKGFTYTYIQHVHSSCTVCVCVVVCVRVRLCDIVP
jgi:hypothetical protein